MKKKLLALLPLLLASSVDAYAYDWGITAHVTIVEATYMPNLITFTIDKNAGTCAAGTWMSWPGQGATTADKQSNAKAVMALLMTAEVTGNSINLYGVNSGCSGQYVHMNNKP